MNYNFETNLLRLFIYFSDSRNRAGHTQELLLIYLNFLLFVNILVRKYTKYCQNEFTISQVCNIIFGQTRNSNKHTYIHMCCVI